MSSFIPGKTRRIRVSSLTRPPLVGRSHLGVTKHAFPLIFHQQTENFIKKIQCIYRKRIDPQIHSSPKLK